MIEFIRTKHPNKCGIVYCLSRRECEEVANKLLQSGIKAAAYHAGLETERESIQRDWCASYTV